MTAHAESSSPASASSRRWATTSTPSGGGSSPASRASGQITRFDTTDHKVHIAAEVKDFDPEDFIDKRKVRRLDLFSRYAVAAAKMAAADAEFDPRPEADRVGAVVGSGVGGLQTLQSEIDKLSTRVRTAPTRCSCP